ncbi:F-box only protein 9-like [Babylonia areolata]|uniref:F-box only protein 9-like n=1 Tax=Babylonia areolata TaxID=304850 RepID=UPI003FD6998B
MESPPPTLLGETGADSPRGHNGAQGSEEEEEEDGESSSPSPNLQEELQEFRQRWQRELQEEGQMSRCHDNRVHQVTEDSVEDEAKALFLQGMQAEQDGALYEAIKYYRRAMQLVPDIEFKIDFYQNKSPRERQDSESSIEGSTEVEEDLIGHFERLRAKEAGICQPEYEQRATHISSLPTEVVMYIFRWVVSSQLDLRSLEVLAQVCRGFYLCARDEGLWKAACMKIWGKYLGSCKKYGGWRHMYIQRPHLLFNGCYISRATYMRQGEQSVDSFYRPFHMVAYYRFLRFFPEGCVLMMCSPEEPGVVVPKLSSPSCHLQGLMKGYYKLSGSKVMCVMRRLKLPDPVLRYKRQRQAANQNDCDQTYSMEFEMIDNSRRCHRRLNWVSYTVRTVYRVSGQETVTDFELKDSTYPPLIFSRVRSYTSVASMPLE